MWTSCVIYNIKCCHSLFSSWSQTNEPYCNHETVHATLHLSTKRSHLVLYSELLTEEHPQVLPVVSSAVLGVAELFQIGRTTPFCNACLPLSGTDPHGVGSGLAFCEYFAMLGSRPCSAICSRSTGRHGAGF